MAARPESAPAAAHIVRLQRLQRHMRHHRLPVLRPLQPEHSLVCRTRRRRAPLQQPPWQGHTEQRRSNAEPGCGGRMAPLEILLYSAAFQLRREAAAAGTARSAGLHQTKPRAQQWSGEEAWLSAPSRLLTVAISEGWRPLLVADRRAAPRWSPATGDCTTSR